MEWLQLARGSASRKVSCWMLAVVAIAMAGPAAAQLQRSMINPSFETPVLTPTTGCYLQLSSASVPGWSTTHPSQTGSGGCTATPAAITTGPLIEMWRSGFNGVIARDGNNFVELNANASSRIYQNVCLINGESFNWRFSHRGRQSTTTPDVAAFKVGASQEIVRVGTTSDGTMSTPVPSAGVTGVSGGNGWADYSGTYAYTGATGTNSLGFESISTAGNNLTVGNFLDNIQIQLAPFVEFVQASSSAVEAAGNNLPQIRVNGTVFSPMTVTVSITGGTATRAPTAASTPGYDYWTDSGDGTLVINIPAGIYDGTSAGSLFTVPVHVIDNTTVQSNRTINFQLQASTSSPKTYLLNSSSTCGASAQATSIYTIIDDDAGVAVTKNVTSKTVVAGNPSQFDIVYTVTVKNTSGTNTASYSLIDTPQFDSNVSVVSVSATKNGSALSPALAGSGPWTLAPTSWSTLAGGGTDTYVVTVRGQVAINGSTANDACTTPGSSGNGLQNSVAATYKASSGPNPVVNADACSSTPTPGWVTLGKTLVGRTTAGDQAQLRIYAGGILSTSANTSGTTAPATATTGATVLASGTAVELRETILAGGTTATAPSTGYATSISCSNATTGSATVLPSGGGSPSGSEQAWSGIALAAGDNITCTITNTPKADLSITKSNGVTTVVSGAQTTYALVVKNSGPAAVTGAVVKDVPGTGITCPTGNVVTCSGTGCPSGTITNGDLLGANGVTMGAMPINATTTFSVTCTVQ